MLSCLTSVLQIESLHVSKETLLMASSRCLYVFLVNDVESWVEIKIKIERRY